jgi:hypothetical protein
MLNFLLKLIGFHTFHNHSISSDIKFLDSKIFKLSSQKIFINLFEILLYAGITHSFRTSSLVILFQSIHLVLIFPVLFKYNDDIWLHHQYIITKGIHPL